MLHREIYVVLAVLLVVLSASVTSSTTVAEKSSNPSSLIRSESVGNSEMNDHYPLAWVGVPYKGVVDNDRLFSKFKACFLANQIKGCPKVITDIIRLAPEVVATNCAKCLPAHIERIKEIVNYLCETRRADFDDIRRIKDPNGALQEKFEKKFGKFNC